MGLEPERIFGVRRGKKVKVKSNEVEGRSSDKIYFFTKKDLFVIIHT